MCACDHVCVCVCVCVCGCAQDVHDVCPVFVTSSYSVSLFENVNVATSVLTVKAIDTDTNAQPEYKLKSSAFAKQFNLDSLSGTLITIGLLDYENKRSYTTLVRWKCWNCRKMFVCVYCKSRIFREHFICVSNLSPEYFRNIVFVSTVNLDFFGNVLCVYCKSRIFWKHFICVSTVNPEFFGSILFVCLL